MEPTFTCLFLLTQPAFELFGSMSGPIIQDEGHGLDLSVQCFRNDLLGKKVLEIDKAFALSAGAVDQPIGNRESSERMACSASVIASFVQEWLVGTSGTRRLSPFSGLKGS